MVANKGNGLSFMKGNLQFAFQSTYRGNTIQWINGLCLCLAQILSFKHLH